MKLDTVHGSYTIDMLENEVRLVGNYDKPTPNLVHFISSFEPLNNCYPAPNLKPLPHASFSNTLTSVPICGRISTANSSPPRSVTLGFLPIPTPAGVPVMMRVPAGRVVPWDR